MEAVEPIYIYGILFAVAFVENIFPPIPGDTFTIIGGYLVAVDKLSLMPTYLAVTLGTITSVMLVFFLGYRGGREFFVRKNYRFFNASDVDRVTRWFDRFGAGTLIFSRFIVGARVAVAIGAGIGKYRPVKMAVYSYLSALIFHGTLIALAFLMHAYINRLAEGFDIYSKIILVIVSALVILWVVFVIRRVSHGRKKA